MTTATPKKPTAKKPGRPAGSVAKKRAPAKKAEAASHPVAVVAEVAVAAKPETAKKIKHITTQNFHAVGRRKTSVAQAILTSGNGTITVNELPFESYFGTPDLQRTASMPLSAVGIDKNVNIRAKVSGGGIHSQAESLRHAISRAVVEMDPESRRTLKKLGFLTRDPRVKERKKPGLKRARRAPQFSKR